MLGDNASKARCGSDNTLCSASLKVVNRDSRAVVKIVAIRSVSEPEDVSETSLVLGNHNTMMVVSSLELIVLDSVFIKGYVGFDSNEWSNSGLLCLPCDLTVSHRLSTRLMPSRIEYSVY